MICHCILRKGVVFVPTFAKVTTGGYKDIVPLEVAPLSDPAEVRQAFREAISRGNPPIPSFKSGEGAQVELLKQAGVKTYSTFARAAMPWFLEEKDGSYKIMVNRRRKDRGWEVDKDQTITLPPDSTLDDAIDRLIAVLQAYDKQGKE